MQKKVKGRSHELRGGGFAACYNGETIATARNFETLANKPKVRELLGNKKLVIKHTVPEGMIAVY